MINASSRRFGFNAFVLCAVATGIICHPRPGLAQSDVQVDFKSIIDTTAEARPRASVTVETETSLTSEGYVQIGTIRATQLGAKVDLAVTKNLRGFILSEAGKNGGDVVLFSKHGVIGRRSTETIKRVCNPLAVSSMFIANVVSMGNAAFPLCPEEAADYIGLTKKQKAIVSEGTVWRRDPELAAYVAKMPEREHLFRLIQKGDKLASIEEALGHDPGLALIRDKNGDTPLHYAAACHEADVVRLLLAYHADVNALDNKQWTPLDEAGLAQAKDVVRILRENGGHF